MLNAVTEQIILCCSTCQFSNIHPNKSSSLKKKKNTIKMMILIITNQGISKPTKSQTYKDLKQPNPRKDRGG
jgi:hypothetical protein